MQLGLDRLAATLRTAHRDARVGLLCHAASLTSDGVHAIDVLAGNDAWRLTTLFGPEHGLAGVAQDMEGVATATHKQTGLPIYSLYGPTENSLCPTQETLADLDLLIIDLQDIGTRYYTYIYTMAFCMQACATAGKTVVVCDRPNPMNGIAIEGSLGDPNFASFVGYYPLPVRHGMTTGELAGFFNDAYNFGADLRVVPMEGWGRTQHWDETGLAWTNPSPNMRSQNAALLYPGQCLLEATNVSEGRGTATPFEWCGAPWIDGQHLAKSLSQLDLPGISVEPTQFTPDARKFAGKPCHGVRFTITARNTFRPYAFGLALVWTLAQSDDFGWRTPAGNPPHSGLDAGPYEFVTDKPAIDLLTGGNAIRTAIDNGADWETLRHLVGEPTQAFLNARTVSLLY